MPGGPSRGVPRVVHVDRQVQNDDLRWWGMFATMAVTTLVIAVVAFTRSTEPFSIALLILVVACVTAFVRPVVGVYLILFLTLVGDAGDDGVVAVHEEHVESRVDLLRQ